VPQERSHRQTLLSDIYLTLSREMNQNIKDSEMWMEVEADSGVSLVQYKEHAQWKILKVHYITYGNYSSHCRISEKKSKIMLLK
jgi:hypothetical protein